MFRGLFVTGTDTDVGKTTVAAALMHRFRRTHSLKYWKPVQTGIEISDDTETVRNLGKCSEKELFDSGVRLTRPLSPHLAARLNGSRIQIDDLIQLLENTENSRWIIEGAGGALVPLNESELMVDLMVRLGLPTIVATRSSLGTINHTLLTLESLRARKLAIAGVVMVGERNPENRKAIEEFGAARVIGEMPRFDLLTADTLERWATSQLDTEDELAGYLG